MAAAAAVLLWSVAACSDPQRPAEQGNGISADTSSQPSSLEGDRPRGGDHQAGDRETEEGGHGHEHPEGIVVLSAAAIERAEIQTGPVQRRQLPAQLSTTGHVDFDQDRLAHVSPRITGRVHRVHAVLGQKVRAGHILAEIDSIELGQAKAAFLQAKAGEELARRSFERTQGLLADRIASEQEVLEAEAALRVAAAELYSAEESLRLYGLSQRQIEGLTYEDRGTSIYPLRAPFPGTVTERHVTLGELVTPERSLFTLADLSRVWIWIDIYQRDLGRVHLEDEGRARVDAYPDEIFAGRVSYLSAQVDVDTRTVRARLEMSNPGGKLRPGMFVEVELVDPHALQGNAARQPSLVVPEVAVVRDGETFAVFVAKGRGRFQRREVRVGARSGGYVEILAGLEVDEPVVFHGAFVLKSAVSKDSLGGSHSH